MIKTIGIDRIVAARMDGYKPDHVFVDVSSTIEPQWPARGMINGVAGEHLQMCQVPSQRTLESAYVYVSPAESTRTMDWSWCIGLRLTIRGDEEGRIRSAFERAQMAKAAHVLAAYPWGPIVSSEGWQA
jgi:hypothetical protein